MTTVTQKGGVVALGFLFTVQDGNPVSFQQESTMQL